MVSNSGLTPPWCSLGAMTEDEKSRITLRLPPALHAQLSHAAEIASRSLNGEIVARLAASFPGEALDLPHSVREAIQDRARAASTSFEAELIRAVVAGLSRGAPAVLMVESARELTLANAQALLEAARRQLPPDTLLMFPKKK